MKKILLGIVVIAIIVAVLISGKTAEAPVTDVVIDQSVDTTESISGDVESLDIGSLDADFNALDADINSL